MGSTVGFSALIGAAVILWLAVLTALTSTH
jgi:hypothetical protein